MTKTKKIFIAFLSGLLVICAGFAALLSRPASQANAEESYSEIWVINEDWDDSKEFSTEINGRVSDESEYEQYRKFTKFGIKKSDTTTYLEVGTFGIAYVSGNGRVFQNIPQVQEMTYDEWKYTFGKVTFYADTSATEYAELRTWLEANATKQAAETPVETVTITIKDGYSGEILGTETINKGSAISNEIAEKYKTIANNRANGRTIDGWEIDGVFSPFPSTETYSQDIEVKVIYFTLMKFFNKGELIYQIAQTTDITISDALGYVDDPERRISFINDENFLGWTTEEGSSTIISPLEKLKYGGVYNFYAVFKTPTYTITFMNGEDVLGTVEAAEGDKLSALELPFFLPVVAGKDFKGWSYEENGELLDLEAETVTEAKTLYAVYEDVVPDTPDNPDAPDNPDKSFEDKVKDFGDKASEWLEQNVGLSISGGAVIVILIAAAILIFSKRR